MGRQCEIRVLLGLWLAVFALSGQTADLQAAEAEYWSVQAVDSEPPVFRHDVLASEAQNARAGSWSRDGLKYYQVSRGNNKVFQLACATPYSIAEARLESVNEGLASGVAHGIFWRPDGEVVFIYQRTLIRAHAVGTPWAIDTADAKPFATYNLASDGMVRGHDLHFREDGLRLYVDCRGTGRVFQYHLDSAWDIATMAFETSYEIPSSIHSAVRGTEFSPDGRRMFLLMVGSHTIWEFGLRTPWDIATAYPAVGLDLRLIDGVTTGIANNFYGMTWLPDGSGLVLSESNGRLTQIKTRFRPDDHPTGGDSMVLVIDTNLGAGNTVHLNAVNPSQLNVDWGDGTIEHELIGSGGSTGYEHTYAESGTYTVRISGSAAGVKMRDPASLSMLTEIQSLGFGLGLTDMKEAFAGAVNLTSVPEQVPISLRDCESMFAGCIALDDPNIGEWDLGGVTNLRAFLRNTSYSHPVSWRFSMARSLRSMMQNTQFNQPLNLELGRAIDIRGMLAGTPFNQRGLAGWDVSTVRFADGFLRGVTLPTAEYDAVLNAWAAQDVRDDISISFGSSRYSEAAAAARATLVEKGWTIIDGGPIDEE